MSKEKAPGWGQGRRKASQELGGGEQVKGGPSSQKRQWAHSRSQSRGGRGRQDECSVQPFKCFTVVRSEAGGAEHARGIRL